MKMSKGDIIILVILIALSSLLVFDGGFMLPYYFKLNNGYVLYKSIEYLAFGLFGIIFATCQFIKGLKNDK